MTTEEEKLADLTYENEQWRKHVPLIVEALGMPAVSMEQPPAIVCGAVAKWVFDRDKAVSELMIQRVLLNDIAEWLTEAEIGDGDPTHQDAQRKDAFLRRIKARQESWGDIAHAALAPSCGVELSERQYEALQSAINSFRATEVEYRQYADDCMTKGPNYWAYKDVERNVKEDAEAIEAILSRARSAKQGETVGARREVLEVLLPVNRSYAKGHCIEFPGKEKTIEAIAEAEAALAAGKGET